MDMAKMIQATTKRYNERLKSYQAGEAEFAPYGARTNHQTVIGKIGMDLTPVQGRSTWMRPHFRRKWYLDGKVIAASTLEKLINQAARAQRSAGNTHN